MVLEQLMEREMLHVWRHYGQRRKKEQQFGGNTTNSFYEASTIYAEISQRHYKTKLQI